MVDRRFVEISLVLRDERCLSLSFDGLISASLDTDALRCEDLGGGASSTTGR